METRTLANDTNPATVIDKAVASWQPPSVVFSLRPALRRHLAEHISRVLAGAPDEPLIDELVPVDPELVTYPGDTPNCAWEALPTKAHLSTDDIEAPGSGPDGWGIYLADMPEEGYFAWFSHEAGAKSLVAEHNEAVETAEELERLEGEVAQLDLRKTRFVGGSRDGEDGVESELRAWPKSARPLIWALAEEARA